MEWKKETLQSLLKLNKEKLVLLFCFGLLLFVITMPLQEAEPLGEHRTSSDHVWRTDEDENERMQGDEEQELESKVRTILSSVEGVGEVEVLITWTADSDDTVFQREKGREVLGVMISAEGGGSEIVKSEISQAMEALFNLPPHKIKVLKRAKKGV